MYIYIYIYTFFAFFFMKKNARYSIELSPGASHETF